MRYLIAILAFFMLASCAVKKRTYRDGYYVDWVFHKKTKVQTKKSDLPQIEVTKKQENIEIVTVSSDSDFQSQDLPSITNSSRIHLSDTCGDIITFASGDQITVRVTEITEDKIKYKRCDNLDGPQFVVSKSTVQSIRYSNGVVEKIEAPVYKEPASNNGSNTGYPNTFKIPPKVHPKAWWALASILGLFWLFGVGLLLGLILSSYAIKEIRANPTKWRGLPFAKFLQIFCIVIIGLVAIGLLAG